ncbi:MAG: phosphatidate cytidylyltransferase [Rhodoferax sp.]
MLRLRVITALVLLAILVPAVAWPDPRVFAVVALVFIAGAAWEWWQLGRGQRVGALLYALGVAGAGLALLGSGAWRQALAPLFAAAAIAWVLGSAWLLRGGPEAWKRCPAGMQRWLGVPVLLLAWWAVALARVQGINFLFSVLALVWAADIGAYFAGRTWGGRWFARKLAPTISPGKTWEGALGGAVCVGLLAWGWQVFDQRLPVDGASLYTRLADQGWVYLGPGLALLVVMSVVGDLVESLIKRAAAVKDSSGLLPGHGGVLDRVDALLPVLPLAVGMVA